MVVMAGTFYRMRNVAKSLTKMQNERFASQDGKNLSKQTLDSIHFSESAKNSGWRVIGSIKTPTAIQFAPIFTQAFRCHSQNLFLMIDFLTNGDIIACRRDCDTLN